MIDKFIVTKDFPRNIWILIQMSYDAEKKEVLTLLSTLKGNHE